MASDETLNSSETPVPTSSKLSKVVSSPAPALSEFQAFLHETFAKLPKGWRDNFVRGLELRGIKDFDSLLKPKNVQALATAIYDQHRNDGRKLCDLARSEKSFSGDTALFTVPVTELYADASPSFVAALAEKLPIYGVKSREALRNVNNMYAVAQALRDIAEVDAPQLVALAYERQSAE